MKKKKVLGLLLVATCVTAILSACTSDNSTANKDQQQDTTKHEKIVMNAPYGNMSYFVDEVHKKYPEINLEVIPYNGQNTTAYVQGMLKSGEIPDIYFTTFYNASKEEISSKLLDLSSYDFLDNYVSARLNDVNVDGAVYMLPLAYSCLGVTYNKTLLDKNGWELPNSLEEMEALKPKVEAAGYDFALTQMEYPGFGFQYLFNILSTSYISTLDGMNWQKDFLAGKTTIQDSPEMLENLKLVKRWKDDGLLNDKGDISSDKATINKMAEGKTLFLIGNSNDVAAQADKETVDEFRIMPYLSVDGSQNVYMLNVSRYVALNKKLEEEGNEQKLEDAAHVLEVISSIEGMQSLNPKLVNSVVYPLKDATVSEDSYYANVLDDLNAGHTAPFIYSGWENMIVPLGETMLDFIKDKSSLDDVINCFDENQSLLVNNEAITYTTVTETLDVDDCARLVGICFAKATGADLALISENKWIYNTEDDYMNKEGVSGSLFPIPVRDEEMVTILPTGWNGKIQTVTLTGARIKELAESGYDRLGNGQTYPYALVTKEGFTIDDNKTYTVVICGATQEVQEEGNLKDTDVIGLDAAKEYFSQYKTFSKKDIVWE